MKPNSKPQAKPLRVKAKREGTDGLWATTNVLWATDPPTYPITFKGSMWDFMDHGSDTSPKFQVSPGGQQEE